MFPLCFSGGVGRRGETSTPPCLRNLHSQFTETMFFCPFSWFLLLWKSSFLLCLPTPPPPSLASLPSLIYHSPSVAPTPSSSSPLASLPHLPSPPHMLFPFPLASLLHLPFPLTSRSPSSLASPPSLTCPFPSHTVHPSPLLLPSLAVARSSLAPPPFLTCLPPHLPLPPPLSYLFTCRPDREYSGWN